MPQKGTPHLRRNRNAGTPEELLTPSQQLGIRMRQAAYELRLTQKQIAEAMDVVPTTVSHWWRGKTEVSATQIHRYSAFVGRTVGWFFGEVDDPVADLQWRVSRLEKLVSDKTVKVKREPYFHGKTGAGRPKRNNPEKPDGSQQSRVS